MNKLKYIRVQEQDNSYSADIPIGADAQNIDMRNNNTLQDTIGNLDVSIDDNITEQLASLHQEMNLLDSDKLNKSDVNNYVPSAVTSWLNANVDPVGSAVTIDKSLSIEGSAADAKIVGEFKKALIKVNLFDKSQQVIIGAINGTTINSSSSNRIAVIPCKPLTSYCIRKAPGNYFQIGFSSIEIETGSTITDKYNYGTATYGTVTSPSNANYMAVWFYNNGDSSSLEEALDTLCVWDASYGEDVTADTFKLENIVDGGIELEAVDGLKKIVYPSDNKDLYTLYYATIVNPSGVAYTNQAARINVNFDKGECRSEKNIVIFDSNGNEIPFQFEGCIENNGLYNDDLTYWNDGSIRCGTLWIYLNLGALESKDFYIRVYASFIRNDYTKIITNNLESNAREFNITDGIKIFNFRGKENSGKKYLYALNGDTNFSCQSNFKLNGTTTYFRDYGTLKDIIINGDGVVFKDVIYKYESTFFNYTERYRIFKNRLIYTTKVISNQIIAANTIENMFFAINLGVSNTTEHGKDPYEYAKFTYNNEPCCASVIYSLGNLPRADIHNTIPIFTPFADVVGVGGIRRIISGWNNSSGSNIKNIPKNFIFGGEIDISFNISDGDIKQINPLVCFSSKKTKEHLVDDIIKICNSHILHTSKIVVALYEHNNYDMDMWAKYFMAKYSNAYSMNDVIREYKQYDINRGLTTAAGILTKWQSGMGVEFLSRYLPLAYYLYLEVDDQTDKDYFMNDVKESGKFFANLFTEYGDIPLSYSSGITSANNNARCGALHNISLAINLGEDLNTQYNGLLSVINDNSAYGTMLPEGNLSTSRYTHYMSFAYFDYVMAKHFTPINNDQIEHGDNFLIDCCCPSGEIKDQQFNPSTARRGLLSTYSYIICSLIMSEKYGNYNAAYNLLKWVEQQDSPLGNIVYPLDRYSSNYTGTQTANSAMFEIPPFVQVLNYLGI